MHVWLIAGIILITSGMANIIVLSKNKKKPNKKGEIPTEKQMRIYRFISLFTFFLGLYFFIGTLAKMG